MQATLLALLVVTAGTLAQQPPADLVIARGRVIDPETGLDAVRYVGIREGRIVAVSETPIAGRETLDASGLVVAPGFIDLHAHGQDPVSNRLQAADGVTTALEMEIGVYPVGAWLASREGKAPIHYGATVGHLPARVKLYHDIDLGSWAMLAPDSTVLLEHTDFAYKEASPSELEALSKLMERGLDEGGLGFGLGITYTPGASREEILRPLRPRREEGRSHLRAHARARLGRNPRRFSGGSRRRGRHGRLAPHRAHEQHRGRAG